MKRLALVLVLASVAAAQDVYVPPVPIGVRGDGKIRRARVPLAFPDPRAQWIRIRSPHFDVLSSAREDRTRDIVSNLETLAVVLPRTSPRFRAGGVRTSVFVFADRADSQPYFDLLLARDKTSATGVYVRHSDGGTMFVDGSRRQRIGRTALHELVHDLLRQGDEIAPLWIEEGLAEYFSTAEVHGGKVTAGSQIRSHAAILRRKIPIRLEEMFALKADAEKALTPGFYAQSWGAVAWLMRMGREKFFTFLSDVESGTSIPDALLKHYGRTLRDMKAGIHSVARTSGYVVELTVEPGNKAAAFAAIPVDRATLLYELARFLSHVAGSEEDAQRHYREALHIEVGKR